MAYFIDRRLNPKDKSLGNRQRFMRRARAQIKEVVNRSIKDRNVADIANGETVTIPTKGIGEHRFRHARSGGHRERVFSGNKEFLTGDRISKPLRGSDGKGGKEGSDHGDGEDDFQFVLSRDEFLDLFFEDLALPDLVKTSLKELYTQKLRRAGYSSTGIPANINVMRTMRNSLSRRLALKRPGLADVEEIHEQILELESKAQPSETELTLLESLRERLEEMERKRRAVAFIDPIDVRYSNFQPQPQPNANAVMFCLMDVSGSMGEREKDLAKRFFMLLYLFLQRRYELIDIVFIRHAHEAQEVDEETFFYGRESGGTVVSTALAKMLEIIDLRYPSKEWNIYAAQASDGENYSGDSEKCIDLLDREVMPLCQYYAYIEILDESEADNFQDADSGAALWRNYTTISGDWPNFDMKRIAAPGDIFPVFHELFSRQDSRH